MNDTVRAAATAHQTTDQHGLTSTDKDAIKLLSKLSKGTLSEENKDSIASFVVRAIGNMKLNKSLSQLLDVDPDELDRDYSQDTIDNLHYFSFKSKSVKADTKFLYKLRRIYKEVINGHELESHEKITLKEYKKLNDLAKIYDFLKKLEENGITQRDLRLKDLYECSKIAHEITTALQKEFDREKKHDSQGAIVVDNIQKRNTLTGKQAKSFFSKLSIQIIKYWHAAVRYTSNDACSEKIAHLNPSTKQESFTLSAYLYTDVFSLKVSHLISKKHQQILQEKLGEDFEKIVLAEYKKIERELQRKLAQAHRDTEAFGEREQRIAGVLEVLHLGKRNPFHKNDFEKLTEEFMNDSPTARQLLCSDFAARSTIATLVLLNRKLKEMTGEDADLINMPFSSHENISKMSPGRLVHVLSKQGCLVKEERKSVESKYFLTR